MPLRYYADDAIAYFRRFSPAVFHADIDDSPPDVSPYAAITMPDCYALVSLFLFRRYADAMIDIAFAAAIADAAFRRLRQIIYADAFSLRHILAFHYFARRDAPYR